MVVLRWAYILAGWLSLLVGLIGVWVPLLPTTPFVLLAAFCFSQGSERLHRWLRNSRLFGRVIQDWETYRGIRTPAKITATVLIAGLFVVTLLVVDVSIYVKAIHLLISVSVLVYLWTRPAAPAAPRDKHTVPC
jgi:uncharacterized protein